MAKWMQVPKFTTANYITSTPLRTAGGGVAAGTSRGASGRAGGFSHRRTREGLAAWSISPRISWMRLSVSSGLGRPLSIGAAERQEAQAGENPIRKLLVKFGRIPDEMRKEMRNEVKQLGNTIRGAAAANALWSTRIPGSLRVRTSLSWKHAGARVEADRGVAPHARPYEGIRGNDSFEKPLFGDASALYTQRVRPFISPAVRTHGPQGIRDLEEGVKRVLANFHKE